MQLEPRNSELARRRAIGGIDDVVLDQQIVANELRRVGVVGMDAADPGRGQDDGLAAARARRSVAPPTWSVQVELGVRSAAADCA